MYADWVDDVRGTLSETEWPVVTIPDGDRVFPDDPLFDSERTYPQNVARVHQHKNGT